MLLISNRYLIYTYVNIEIDVWNIRYFIDNQIKVIITFIWI